MSKKIVELSKLEIIDIGCALLLAQREYKKLAKIDSYWEQEAKSCRDLLKKINF